MISLKASRFRVKVDDDAENGYSVYTRDTDGYKDITKTLTNEEKEELISDLIYAITDLLNKGE